MESGFWFISYSRRQLYFAESLAVNLLTHELEVWFDLQRLDPGSDWADGIRRGLEGCTGLLLVASQASLASKYVLQEVQAARDQGKPVVIVLFEAVELPPDLLDLPRLDFRGNFGRNLNRLLPVLRDGAPVSDPLPAPGPGGLPTRLAPGVLLTALSLVTMSLTSFALAGFLAALVSPYWSVLFVVAGVYLPVMLLRQFLTRQGGDTDLKVWIQWSFFPALLALVLFFPQLSGSLPLLLTFGVLVISWIVYLFAINTADILRWTPTGEDNPRLRLRINRSLTRQVARTQPQPRSRTYNLHSDPADHRIMAQVHHEMQQAKHEYRMDDPAVDYEVLILSNQSKPALVEQFLTDSRRLIVVLASSVQFPVGADELKRYQWVDYRRQPRGILRTVAEDLWETGASATTRIQSIMVTPENFVNIVIPPAVQAGTALLRLLAAIGIALTLMTYVISGLLPAPANTPLLTVFDTPALLLSVTASLVANLVFFWLTSQVIRRQITLMQFRGILALTTFATSFTTLLNLGVLVQDAVSNAGTATLGVLLFYEILFARRFREWLPVGQLFRRPTGTLPGPAARFRRQYGLVTAAAIGILVYLFVGLQVVTPVIPAGSLFGVTVAAAPVTTPVDAGDLSFNVQGDCVEVDLNTAPTAPATNIGQQARQDFYTLATQLAQNFAGIGSVRWGDLCLLPDLTYLRYLVFTYTPEASLQREMGDNATGYVSLIAAVNASDLNVTVVTPPDFPRQVGALTVQTAYHSLNLNRDAIAYMGIQGPAAGYWLIILGDERLMDSAINLVADSIRLAPGQ